MEYRKITRPEELSLLSGVEGPLRFLAGGTDLMYRLNKGLLKGDKLTVADISGLDQCRGIREEDDYWIIGSLTTFSELQVFARSRDSLSLPAKALELTVCRQIRNMATIGGHLAGCYPNSHLVPAFLACGAEYVLFDGKERSCHPLEELPGRPFQTGLPRGTMIEALKIPKRVPERVYYWGSGDRSGFAFPPFVLAAMIEKNGTPRIAAGSRECMPHRLRWLEEALAADPRPGRKEMASLAAAHRSTLGEYGFIILTRLFPFW